MMRRISVILAPLLVVVLGIEVAARVGDVNSYEKLRPVVLVSSRDPIFGPDELEYAMTYGLTLEAAVGSR